MKFLRRIWPLITLTLLVGGCGFVWMQQEAIGDWFALRRYDPPNIVQALAHDTTMTSRARDLFYVNHPSIEDRDAFNKHCTNEREQTVVLGCYLGNRHGIYLFNVQTAELHGVQQVTAAHEMLHQAYDRLSVSEQKHINGLLESFAKTLTDQTLLDQIAAYKQSEPDAVPNEMHSLFGTQVGTLPPELEAYYRRYFTNRAKIVTFYDSYQAAFNTRKAQIKAYDTEIATQKATISKFEGSLEAQLTSLDAERVRLDSLQNSGDITAYNRAVPGYNQLVDVYNDDLAVLRGKVAAYNQLVKQRNAIALQEQQLQQDLSSKQLPSLSGQ